MKIINQTWKWLQKPVKPLDIIEVAGRTCYKSEQNITNGSATKFVNMILDLGHESVLEHTSASIRFITNRGVTHELVRHRLASFSQESTRYVRYSDQLVFIKPIWWDDPTYPEERKKHWESAMAQAEKLYLLALQQGDKPEQAREILPHAIKTEIVVTTDLREWRHIFDLRCAKKAHPQIRSLMLDCLHGFAKEIPVIFDELVEKYKIMR
ncbi:MAG: FAD-dependent thymidylate synthase [Coxiellaceae bacterium]|jgi:thymidylate synthase (FAD)|nr:FAD-dependent thymidylate synthase [Coxiellaceae bacterium]